MSDSPSNPPLHSLLWRENFFENHWEKIQGSAQTRHFMEVLAANLAEPERDFLISHEAAVFDWGCALATAWMFWLGPFPDAMWPAWILPPGQSTGRERLTPIMNSYTPKTGKSNVISRSS